MKRIAHSLLVVVALTLALALGGCSNFTKSGRQQRAYAKYIRKSSYARSKQSLKLRPGKVQLPPMPVSDAVVSSDSGPQAMPSENL
jgi:hypothetical protein